MTSSSFIPLAQLPEVYRNVITAWNKLPLTEKLKGLFTDKAKEVYALLKQFGEAAVHKAIRTVAECPYLLGRSRNSRGWIVSFGWLMKPQNMEKVLADRYRDKERAATWDNVNENTTTCLLDPAEMFKGVTNLSDQARRGLMNAAAKLGLTKGQVA